MVHFLSIKFLQFFLHNLEPAFSQYSVLIQFAKEEQYWIYSFTNLWFKISLEIVVRCLPIALPISVRLKFFLINLQ